ncbi:ribosomal protein S6 [Hysterangium stoloniferum]|nr:ribosomal protein S6 [Hysterangium stoloniferum]
MPLYELLCVAGHFPQYVYIKELVTTCATHVMDAGGVVRSINSWGTRTLPARKLSHKRWHTVGDYWTMHFDTNPRTLHELNRKLRQDPRVIRWTMTKLGEKIEDIAQPNEKTIQYIKTETLRRDFDRANERLP